MTEYPTSENLTETAKDLSKGLFNIYFTWWNHNKAFQCRGSRKLSKLRSFEFEDMINDCIKV